MIKDTLKEIVEQIVLNNTKDKAFTKIQHLSSVLREEAAVDILEYYHSITIFK